MVFFNYNNNQKISLIKRNLPDKLAYKIIDNTIKRSFPQFANKYKTIDTQTRQFDNLKNNNSRETRGEGNNKEQNKKGGENKGDFSKKN